MEEFNVDDFGEESSQSLEEKRAEKDMEERKTECREPRPSSDHPSNTYSFTRWSEVFFDTFLASGDSKKELPAGLYTVKEDGQGRLNFIKKSIYTDELINFSDSVSDRILKEIDVFWCIGEDFRRYKFLHRRGYLLYGPPGGGKSVIVQQIIDGIIKKNGVAFWIDGRPTYIIEGIQILRKIEPNRPVVVIFEDIDAIIDKFGEAEILSYLDGEGNVDTLLNIATTNFPKRLDKRIVARPRRFDRVEKIGMPNSNVRKEFFKIKLKLDDDTELERWAKDTDGFSFAALTDLIISVKCFKYSYDEAVEKLKTLLTAKFKDDEFGNNTVGFNAKNF